MTDQPFLKCPCQNCGGAIEFPAQGVGLKIECPHCAQRTVLTDPQTAVPVDSSLVTEHVEAQRPAENSPQVPRTLDIELRPTRSRAVLFIVLAAGIAALAGGGLWYSKSGPGRSQGQTASGGRPPSTTPAKPGTPSMTSNTGNPAEDGKSPEAGDKSLDDLKPGNVTLEKAKSGSLMYAVGTVKNDSPHQRFGVKVEIEFTDAKGRAAGKASDYTQLIEPRQEWRFRALVLDAKAVRGKVVALHEDK